MSIPHRRLCPLHHIVLRLLLSLLLQTDGVLFLEQLLFQSFQLVEMHLPVQDLVALLFPDGVSRIVNR